jgi:glycerol-3-phosphate acyltransferase PlsY
MTAHTWLVILIPIAYLLGSIPCGLLVGFARGVDVRKAGSGNIGATNVGRLLGGKFFALVFVLDLLKSLVPMLVAAWIVRHEPASALTYTLWLCVGAAAMAGHMFSIFLGFKGGKGVSTGAGFVLGLYPYFTLPALGAIATFIVVFYAWRYVSLASIVSAISLPAWYVGLGLWRGWDIAGTQLPLLIVAVLFALMVVMKHRGNIARLRAGTEPKFVKKPVSGPATSA